MPRNPLEPATFPQYVELGRQLTESRPPKLTRPGLQGIVDYPHIVNQLGELASAGIRQEALEKCIVTSYVQAFDLNSIHCYFHQHIFGFLRMLITMGIKSENVREITRLYRWLPASKPLDLPSHIFFGEWADHLGTWLLQTRNNADSYWIPGFLCNMKPYPYFLRDLIEAELIELKEIDMVDFIAAFGRQQKDEPHRFALFPSDILVGLSPKWRKLDNFPQALTKKFNEEGFHCQVREATLWELLFFYLPFQYALRQPGYPCWREIQTSLTLSMDGKIPALLKFTREGRAKITLLNKSREDPGIGIIPVIDVTRIGA